MLWNEGYATPFEKILHGLQVLHGSLITTGHAAPVRHGLQVLHGWLITTGHAAPVRHGAQDWTGTATAWTLGAQVGQTLQGHNANAGAEIKANKPNIARYFFISFNLLFLYSTILEYLYL